jgi:hypothetical protein
MNELSTSGKLVAVGLAKVARDMWDTLHEARKLLALVEAQKLDLSADPITAAWVTALLEIGVVVENHKGELTAAAKFGESL